MQVLAPQQGGGRVEAFVQVDGRQQRLDRIRLPLEPFAAPERAPPRVRVGLRRRPAAASRGGEGADGVLVPQQHAAQLHVLEEPKVAVRWR